MKGSKTFFSCKKKEKERSKLKGENTLTFKSGKKRTGGTTFSSVGKTSSKRGF